MNKRVADIIMETLLENGINTCFSVVGGGAMHLNNAMALQENMEKIFNHHEQACAMAAEAYSRYNGKMAAVVVTSGPGGTNAITGVMGAWQDSLPMIVISGQVRYETTIENSGLPLRYRGVQEFDIINSVQNMTKYSKMIIEPLEIKREVQKAIDIALDGRRGPVWIDVPLNVQSSIVDTEELYPTIEVEPACKADSFTESDMKAIIEKLSSAKRPCILAGNGIRNSDNIERFREFALKSGIPVIAAAIAGDVMYSEYSKFYGMSGVIGPRPGNFIVQNADVILSLGCSLGYKMTGFAQEYFAQNAYIISVEIDENEVKKPGVKVDELIQCDLRSFFGIANKVIQPISVDDNWIKYCDDLKSRFSPFDPAREVALEERVNSYYFWEKYQNIESDESISILGNNTANSSKLQIGVNKPKQRIIANNNCGSMGADLPEAVGAAIASGKQVICLTGDGSIMMNLQEIQTIVHYKLPVKIIVFSNDGYGAIRQTCKNFFDNTYIGCTADSGVSFPNFEKLANTFNMPYKLCKNNSEVEESLKWIFEEEGQGFLEVLQRFDDPVSPKVMSRLNEDGTFSSPALHDMAPFLTEEEMSQLMFW